MMIRIAERDLETRFGTYTEILYHDHDETESIALVKGDLASGENIICRVHSACIGGHVFNSVECTCAEEMAAAQAAIQNAGKGVIIYLDQEGKGNGHLALMKSIPFKKAGFSQSEAYEKAGFSADARNFRSAAEILSDLQIKSVILITGNPEKVNALRKASIIVAGSLDAISVGS